VGEIVRPVTREEGRGDIHAADGRFLGTLPYHESATQILAAIHAAPDLLAEVERLRSFVEIARKVPYSHLIFVPGGYDLLEALAALKEVPTDV